jgi:predicted nucleic acid-binding protein
MPTGKESPDAMPRVVLDTNVLIADAYNPRSSSASVVAACLDGRAEAVVSPAVVEEYEFILPRAVRGRPWRERLAALLAAAHRVEPAEVPAVVAADPSDDHLFAAARAGGASAVVTNDAAVLAVGAFEGALVLTPRAFADTLGPPPAQPGRRGDR